MLHQYTTLRIFSLLLLIFVFACTEEKATKAVQKVEEPTDKSAQFAATEDKATEDKNAVKDGPAIAYVVTDKFVMKLHKAIAFYPKSDPFGMFKVTEGHHFIVLDM